MTGAAAARPHRPEQTVDHEVVIVGTGFGGIAMAIQLGRLGFHDIVMLDRADDLGGTWHANTYPGVAVDIASPTYSFSFAPNPEWTRLFAPGDELKAYAEDVAERFDVRRHMRFGRTVTGAEWDEAGCRWVVAVDGEPSHLRCRYLVLATGNLSQVKWPDIPGLDTFEGTILHTAAWDHDHSVAGERVAQIGTGATGVQLLPELADVAASVEVFQRTPIWVAPKPDVAIPPTLRRLFRRVPLTQRLLRWVNGVTSEVIAAALLFDRDLPFLVPALEALCRLHMRVQVRDRDTREALTPDYDFWCKRPTFSNTYFRAYNREHVELVTTPIERVTPTGITTTDGEERELDTIVLATGFALQEDGNYPPVPVVGRDGVEMGAWFAEHGYESYEGLTVAGYPNLLYTSGPFSFTGLSFFTMAESQMAHVDRLIRGMRDRGAGVFEVTREAQERFVAHMERMARHTVWQNGSCGSSNSYYFNQHGQTRLGRLDLTAVALWRDRHFDLDDYAFAALDGGAVARPNAADEHRERTG